MFFSQLTRRGLVSWPLPFKSCLTLEETSKKNRRNITEEEKRVSSLSSPLSSSLWQDRPGHLISVPVLVSCINIVAPNSFPRREDNNNTHVCLCPFLCPLYASSLPAINFEFTDTRLNMNKGSTKKGNNDIDTNQEKIFTEHIWDQKRMGKTSSTKLSVDKRKCKKWEEMVSFIPSLFSFLSSRFKTRRESFFQIMSGLLFSCVSWKQRTIFSSWFLDYWTARTMVSASSSSLFINSCSLSSFPANLVKSGNLFCRLSVTDIVLVALSMDSLAHEGIDDKECSKDWLCGSLGFMLGTWKCSRKEKSVTTASCFGSR